jgi:hypothetical protein
VDSTVLRIGTRVSVKRIRVRGLGVQGGESGTILAQPTEHAGGPSGGYGSMYCVLADDGTLYRLAREAFEVCDGAVDRGLETALQVLDAKRAHLRHDLTCLLAAARHADLRDPNVREQVETEVERMTSDWTSADSAATRRKEFVERPELRSRFVGGLSKYLEASELIGQVAALLDDDASSDAPLDAAEDAGASPVADSVDAGIA